MVLMINDSNAWFCLFCSTELIFFHRKSRGFKHKMSLQPIKGYQGHCKLLTPQLYKVVYKAPLSIYIYNIIIYIYLSNSLYTMNIHIYICLIFYIPWTMVSLDINQRCLSFGSPPSLTESIQIPPFFSFSPVALISEMHLCKHRRYRNSWDLPSGNLT